MTLQLQADSSYAASRAGCSCFAPIASNTCGGFVKRLAFAVFCLTCLLFPSLSAKAAR
jgi:hypothetical protein